MRSLPAAFHRPTGAAAAGRQVLRWVMGGAMDMDGGVVFTYGNGIVCGVNPEEAE